MFRYPCSYLIHSDAFTALPAESKNYIYQRLWEILTAKKAPEGFEHLSDDDRGGSGEVLRHVPWFSQSLGVVGAAALALVLVTAVRAVAASAVARTDKAVCLAVFVTGFTIASLSYGIWQGWWLGALWLAAAFTVAAARPRLRQAWPA